MSSSDKNLSDIKENQELVKMKQQNKQQHETEKEIHQCKTNPDENMTHMIRRISQ